LKQTQTISQSNHKHTTTNKHTQTHTPTHNPLAQKHPTKNTWVQTNKLQIIKNKTENEKREEMCVIVTFIPFVFFPLLFSYQLTNNHNYSFFFIKYSKKTNNNHTTTTTQQQPHTNNPTNTTTISIQYQQLFKYSKKTHKQ
jgi:hypothetical protein